MQTLLLQITDSDESYLSLILALAIAIIIFLIFRVVLLWYWEINKTIAYQKKRNEQQQSSPEELDYENKYRKGKSRASSKAKEL
ncbi:hypothetical protein [Sphingobacterium humi]|uniref:Uncharacterized protein n=1 Tax=Sphingobacterium humi TaxID=1796905 RepID=A0A6N8KSI0_9SPHI|nr:hypothetical protein [Sphingobacterium humi]MVZ60395.1 hypothetical protein [Sphingobacterium humi]